MSIVLKTVFPSKFNHVFSQTKLERPPLPLLGQQGPPVSRYNPKDEFTRLKHRVSTIGQDARFDSLRDRNRIAREQVGPVSYNVKDFKSIHRPYDRFNFKGKFPRDTSERLTSSRLY